MSNRSDQNQPDKCQRAKGGRLLRIVRNWRTWWRLLWGFCPECNSDAPEMDTCKTCKGWWSGSTGNTFPPPEKVKADWLRRFNQARCTHGYPIEDQCPECSRWMRDHFARTPINPRRGWFRTFKKRRYPPTKKWISNHEQFIQPVSWSI